MRTELAMVMVVVVGLAAVGCVSQKGAHESRILYDEDGRQNGCVIPPIACEGKSVPWLLGQVQRVVRSRLQRRFSYILLLRDQRVTRTPQAQKISSAELERIAALHGHPATIGPLRRDFPGGPLYAVHDFLYSVMGYWADVNTHTSNEELTIYIGAPELLDQDYGRPRWVRLVGELEKGRDHDLELLPSALPSGGCGAAYDRRTGAITVVAPDGAEALDWLRETARGIASE